MANPTTLSMPKQSVKPAEVTPAATAEAQGRRFVTTTGDAPISNGPTNPAKLNAKTLAEHAAGKQALAQYAPAASE
jgi:hypothetical protein